MEAKEMNKDYIKGYNEAKIDLYEQSIPKLADALGNINGATCFNMSVILSSIFDIPKEETLDDILKARQQILNIKPRR